MRRWAASSLLACACFSEPSTSGDDSDTSSSVGPDTSATSATPTTTTATEGTDTTTSITSTVDSDATMSTGDVSSGSTDGSTADSTAGGCASGIAVPAHDGWTGPVAMRMGIGEPAMPCPGGMPESDWGLLGGASATCTCECQGDPSILCGLSVSHGVGDCVLATDLFDDCHTVGSADHLAVDVSGATCDPDLSMVVVPPDAASVQACELPPPIDGCVDIPRGFEGPCVLGGDGACPDGYEAREAFGSIQGCACGLDCSTASYCDEVVVTTFSVDGCVDGNELAEIAPDGACEPTVGGSVASVEFEGTGGPDCPDVPAASLHVDVCCVP